MLMYIGKSKVYWLVDSKVPEIKRVIKSVNSNFLDATGLWLRISRAVRCRYMNKKKNTKTINPGTLFLLSRTVNCVNKK